MARGRKKTIKERRAAIKRWNQTNWSNRMVRNSRHADKRAGRAESSLEYITPGRILDMLTMQNGLCYYCDVVMTYGLGVDRRQTREAVTIERIANDIGHVVENVVLACCNCNALRSSSRTFDEMVTYGKIKQMILMLLVLIN